jgi:hypothetical protein
MHNNYQLAGNLQTTGWHPSYDVNAKNDYGMTPAEVALQAGNLSEFKEITLHPEFQPEKMGRVGLFLNICRRGSESHYKTMKLFIDENFRFDTSVRAYVKLA